MASTSDRADRPRPGGPRARSPGDRARARSGRARTRCRRSPRRPGWRVRGRRRSPRGPLGGVVVGLRRAAPLANGSSVNSVATATNSLHAGRIPTFMLLGIAVPLRTFPTIGGAGTQPAVTVPTAALVLDDVGFTRGGRHIIGTLSLRVERENRWLVLGPNGSGKTTLLRIAALYEHPSRGTVDVLGERLGRTDVRTLRRRIGYASSALAAQLRPELSARRRRQDGEVRRARALVASLRRRRHDAGGAMPGPDGGRTNLATARSARCRRASNNASSSPAH